MRIDELQDALATAAGEEEFGAADPVEAVRHRVARAGARRRRAFGGLAMVAALLVVVVVVVRARDDKTQRRLLTDRASASTSSPTSPTTGPTIGPLAELPLQVAFTSDTTGWVVTDDRLLHTVDAGASWAQVALPDQVAGFGSYRRAFASAVIDDANAWVATIDAAGTTIYVARSSDGAQSVTTAQLPAPMAASAVSLSAPDAQHGFLGLRSTNSPIGTGQLYATSDGGSTWSLVADNAPVAGLWFRTPTDGWADGNGLFRTNDGGRSWVRVHPPGWDQVGVVQGAGPDYSVVWQEGARAVIVSALPTGMLVSVTYLTTSDDGVTWRDVSPPDLGPIYGTGPQAHLAVGGPGELRVLKDPLSQGTSQLFISDDNGATWTAESSDARVAVASLDFASSEHAWLLAERGGCSAECPPLLWRGADSGRSWTPVDLPPRGLHLVPGPYGFVVPDGWTAAPLANHGGPASFATWTDPSSPRGLVYEVSGGEVGALYNADGSVNLDDALTLITCPVTSHTFQPPYRLSYRCADVGGDHVQGVLIVSPKPDVNTWRSLQIRMSPSDDDLATAILQGLT